MTDDSASARSSTPAWLWILYAVLVLSAVALAVILLGDLIAAIETGDHPDAAADEGLHHLFIFDLAYPVFLVGSLVTLLAGIGALIVSVVRRVPGLRRFAVLALGFGAVAVAILFTQGAFES